MGSIEQFDSSVTVTLCVFGLFLVATSLTAGLWADTLHLPLPMIAVAFGIACGPAGLGLLSFGDGWLEGRPGDFDKEILLWLTRVVIGIQVLSGGVSLPSKLIMDKRFATSMFTLLIPQMILAWLITASLVYLVLPGVTFADALVVGACVAPTDPVVASQAVQSKFAHEHVPEHVRHVILTESCFNDGTGTPFIFASLMILLRTATIVHQPPWVPKALATAAIGTAGETQPAWFIVSKLITNVLLWNVVVGALLGLFVGTIAQRLLKFGRERSWLKEESTNIFTIVFALGLIGLAELLDVNEMLACFIAGNALNWDNYFHQQELVTHFTEGLDSLLDVIVFTFIGTVLPLSTWFKSPSWTPAQLFLLAALVLALRRLPGVVALSRGIPELTTWRERFFTGWFGPIGVAAMYYSLVALKEVEEESFLDVNLFPIISWLVTASVVVHGITVPVLMLVVSSSNASYGPLFLPNAGREEAQTDDRLVPDSENESS